MEKKVRLKKTKGYFELVTAVAVKNVSLRYKNSIFGFLWSLLTPLIYLVIFSFIFSHAFPDISNYPLFVLTGIIFWSFFSGASIQIMNSVVESAGVLKSLNIPVIIFPLSALIAALINFLFSLGAFFIIMLFFGFHPTLVTLAIIPAIVLFSFFTFGFSLLLCTFNVYFRDVGLLWNTLTPALFYFTPIAYSYKLVPEKIQWVIRINPLFHFMEMVRDILYYNRFPSLQLMMITFLLAASFTCIGLYFFNKLRRGFFPNL
jgi:ABC-type polysaccharide/polyol phosphate export permease